MTRFILADRNATFLVPPTIDDWVDESHLARFIAEAVDSMDLSRFSSQYSGRGSAAHHPATLLAILIYGYATGVFSSRRLEQATYDSVAFRFLAANTHPDHDTLASFRRRFLAEFAQLFLQVLDMATEMKLLNVGTVCLDGTKLHANASRHCALSYGHIVKREEMLKAQVAELLQLAEAADQTDVPPNVSLPEEIQRREDRLAAMAQAKAKIEARAKVRYTKEKADYDAKMAARKQREHDTGKKSKGRKLKAPDPAPKASDQVNLTDEESRIMPVAGGGFDQCYNAQAAVDATTMLVIATGMTAASNDKEQVAPMLETLQTQATTKGQVTELVADTGYFSEKNIEACIDAGITPLIAVKREPHYADWRLRHSEPAQALADDATPVEAMNHRLRTNDGRSIYALRKQTVEPVFGIIKQVMGFRQLSLRGLEKVQGEWTLVCLAWNLKRLAKLRPMTAQMA